MNTPGSREELEAMGFRFERRTNCRAENCGATLEWWTAASGRWVPFRIHPRTGKLIQHSDECPGKWQFRRKAKQEETAEDDPRPAVKPKAAEPQQGSLFNAS